MKKLSRRDTLKLFSGAAAAAAIPARISLAAMADTVEYRRLGKTDLAVSVVGFGGLSIGLASTEQARVDLLLNQALDNGLNFIDTAECYGHPEKSHSEILIGNAVATRRDEFILSSKAGHENGVFGGESDWSMASLSRSIDRSLERLKTDYIDIMHLHGCSVEELQKGEVIEALKKAQEQGKIRFLAYSGGGDRVRYAIESGEFDVVQLDLNVFEQQNLDDAIPMATERDLGVIIKRPIGNAVWRYDERPDWFYYQEYWDLLEPLDYAFFKGDALEDPGPNGAGGMALRFTTSSPGVHTTIVGTTSPGRWTQNNGNVAAGRLSEEEYEAIRARWRAVIAKPT